MDTLAEILTSCGLATPITRGIFGASLFSLPIIFHSSISYTQLSDGVFLAKEFYFTAGKDTAPQNTTYFHWTFWPVLGAALFGLFL